LEQRIADIIADNTVLTHIDLSSNCLGDFGVKKIAQALQLNHTLYSLVLRDNNITEVGLKLLDASLNVNSTLKHISLLTHTPKDKMLPHTTLANEIEKKSRFK